MLVNIWVKYTFNGNIHQVGTDVHDSLELCDGAVHYVNMQCMEGTYGGAYEFVEAPDIDDYVSVTPKQLMINRELIHKDILKAIETKGEEIWQRR